MRISDWSSTCALPILDATTSDPLGDGCPMHQQGAIRSLLGRTSRDWWPNQLSLDILHQHGRSGNPLGDDFDYRKALEALDYAGVKRALHALLTASKPWWTADYGSSEERRVGRECDSTCGSVGEADATNKN